MAAALLPGGTRSPAPAREEVADTAFAGVDGDTYRGTDNQLRVKVPRIDEPVAVDGNLDAPVWARAAALTGFSEYSPADGRPAEDSTIVMVWYSPTAIYFGIRAFEAHGAVHATLAKRDAIDADDNVQILLNTFHDGRRALVFGSNPLGIQEDGAMVEGGTTGQSFNVNYTNRPPTDLSPDYVYETKAHVTAFGYEIEMRIPFTSIKYPSTDPQDWGINIIRNVQHSGHVDSWVPVKRSASSFLGQSGVLAGLTNFHRQLILDLNPIVTEKSVGVQHIPAGWSYSVQHPEFGGNLRYGLTSNLILNGTVNPDFAEVEADATQLSFDPRRALYYTEKRPFFLDGLEQFNTPNTLVYTRQIIQPVAAAKITGTVGGTAVAYLSALDEMAASATGHDNPLFNIVRLQRNLGPESRLGVVLTDKEDAGSFNRLAGADSHVPFGGVYSLDLQAAASSSRDSGRTALGPLWQGHLARTARNFGFDYILTGWDPDFHASSGFITRPGIVHGALEHHLTTYGAPHTLLENITDDILLDGTWQYNDFIRGGAVLEKWLHFDNTATLHGGWTVTASIFFERFLYDSTLYPNYYVGHIAGHDTTYTRFVGSSHLSNTDKVVVLGTPQFAQFSGSIFYLWGPDDNFFEWSAADIQLATLTLDWRPTSKLRVEGTYNLQNYKRHVDGTTVATHRIPRLKLEYQVSRPIFIRLVGQYDAQYQDNLRDASRTELPLFIYDPATSTYARASGFTTNLFRVDWLFAYQPVPGTVFFAGYGNSSTEPLSFHFQQLRRTDDGFFVKFSYLIRM
jgi:hypothetical protein